MTKKIEVLGPGCPKCQKTEEIIEKKINEIGIDAEIEHITELNEITVRGVMLTPAVIVEGEIMIEGKIPSEEEIESWFE